MRRVLPVALLGALLAVSPWAMAQRGGIGRGGGHGGGFAGHSFGHFGAAPRFGGSFGSPGRIATFGPHAFSTAAPHIMGASPRIQYGIPHIALPQGDRYGSPYGRGYDAGRQAWRDHRNGDRDRDRGRDRGYGYSGYGGYLGYLYPGYASSWELLPWDISSDNTDYDEGDYGADINSGAAEQQQSESEPPEGPGYGPAYPPPPYSGYPAYSADAGGPWGAEPRPQAPDEPVAPEPKLTLIFRDGHQQAIRNYALTPNAVIVMDQAASGRQQEIPLAELNLPATEQAAQQAGLAFAPPS